MKILPVEAEFCDADGVTDRYDEDNGRSLFAILRTRQEGRIRLVKVLIPIL